MSQTAPFLTPWQSTSWTLAQAGQVGGQATAEAAGLGAASATAAGTAAGAGTALQMPGMLPVLGGTGLVALAMHDWDRRPAQPAQTPPDPRAPQLVSVQGKAAEDSLILRFDEAIDASRLPDAQAFEVVQAGRTLSVTRVEVNGQEVTLRLDGDLREGAFSLSYTDPSSADDAQALQDSSGNDIASLMRGVVADGYILGAKIYVDQDGDGLPDPEEDTGVSTGADGSFLLSAQDFAHPLLAVGGINIDMGLPNTMVLQGAAGSGVINPLSTLVMRLARQGELAPEAAAQQLALALGLQPPAGVSLVDYDPLADTGAAAVGVQVVAAQLATLMNLAGANESQQALLLDRVALQISAKALERQADARAAALNLADTRVIEQALAAVPELNSLSASELANKLAPLAQADSLSGLTLAQSTALGLPMPADGAGAPALKIGASRLQLKAGEQPIIAFAFSEAVQGFALSDVSVTGGSLGTLSELLPGRIYTARLSPTPGRSGEIVLSVSGALYTDGSANTGASDAQLRLNIDSQGPMATAVRITPAQLKAGQTAEVAFVFDEPVAFLDLQQVSVSQGSLSGLTASEDRTSYTAIYTPPTDTARTTVTIELPAAAYLDAAGNRGVIDAVGSSVDVDTRQPLATLSRSPQSLRAGMTATLSVAFDEPIDSLDTGAVKTSAGSLSDWTQISNQLWTATFTPPTNAPASLVTISLPASAYQDLAGNTGGVDETALGLSVDTALPTLTLSSSLDALRAGQTTTLRFEFSEAVQGFDASDVQLTGGSLSQWSPATDAQAGKVFTATFTPDADRAGPTGSVQVAASAYADLAGNTGSGEQSLSLKIDTLAPRVSSISANGAQDRISLIFDSALDASALPQASDFSVVQGGRTLTPSTISASGRELILSGLRGLDSGPFTLSYTDTAGDGTAQIQDLAGNDAGSFVQGIVADGYIRGARIYIDANRDGIAQDSEYTGIHTGPDGSFLLPSLSASGPILAVGGVNIDTGVPNTLTLSAPAGALVINPLTTLVAEVVRTSANPDTDAQLAASSVAQALGLTGVNLLTLDPLASNEGLAVQKQAAKVATLLMAATQDAPPKDAPQTQAQLLSALAQAVNDHLNTSSSQPLALTDAGVLQQVLDRAGLSEPEAADSLLSSLQTLAKASDFSSIALAQSKALDRSAPAAPVFDQVVTGGAGIPPQLVFALKTLADDGSAVTAGDVLHVSFNGGERVIAQTVTAQDIARGKMSVAIAPEWLNAAFEVQLIDSAGNQGASASRPAPSDDTINLGEQLSALILTMLQGTSRAELPLVGSLSDIASTLATPILSALARLPSLKSTGTPTVRADEPMPLLAVQLSTFSEDLPTIDDWYLEPDPVPPWDDPYDIDWDIVIDPDDIPPPVPDDWLPPPADEDDGPPLIPVNPDASGSPNGYWQWLTHQIGYDALTGEGKLRLAGTWRDFKRQATGQLGGDSLNLKLDTELSADLGFALDVEIKRVEKTVSVDGVSRQRSYIAIDTENSGLHLFLSAGLNPGDQASGTLGPITLTLTDQVSSRASAQASRKNTALEASLGLKFRDNDDKPEDQLHTLDKETFDKFIDQVLGDKDFSLGDWYALRAQAEGRLSAQAQLLLDFNAFAADPSPEAKAVLDFLRINPEVDLTVPLKLSYDSTQTNNVQDYGRIYLDNMSIGMLPLVSEKLGPMVSVMNSRLSWLFDFEEFMREEIAENIRLPQPLGPIALPDWLTEIVPGTKGAADYETSMEYSLESLVNRPIELVNQGLQSLNAAMDANADGKISNFELIKATALFYYTAVNNLEAAWASVSNIPGVRDGLIGSGWGSVAVTLLDSLKVQKPIALKAVQGILVIEDVLGKIDSLSQLSQLYELALQEAQASPALQLALGSHVIDFKTNTWQVLDRAFSTNVLDYLYPVSENPEPDLSYQEAIHRIRDLADSNLANASNLHVHVFKAAGIDRVTEQTLPAFISMINSSAVNGARMKLNKDAETVRDTNDPGSADGKRPQDGIQDEVNAYSLIVDLVNGQPYNTSRYSEDEWNIIEKFGFQYDSKFNAKSYTKDLVSAFQTLGVIASDFKPSTDTQNKYMGELGKELLYDIMRVQSFRDVDTIDELKALWAVHNKIIGIKNQDHTLTLTPQELALIKLPVLNSDDIGQANISDSVIEKISSYSASKDDVDKPYKTLYETLDSFIELKNQTYLDSAPGNALLSDAALNALWEKIGTSHTFSLEDLRMAGITGVSTAMLPLINDLLSTKTQEDIDTNNNRRQGLQDLVEAIATFYRTVNDETVPTDAFASAMSKILGTEAYGEFWNEASLLQLINESRDANDSADVFLKGLFAAKSWDQTDSGAEITALMAASTELAKTLLIDERLYQGREWRQRKDWDSLNDSDKDARTGYTSQLNEDDFELLGFDVPASKTQEVVTLLKSLLVGERYGKSDSLENFVKAFPSYRDLGNTVRAASADGLLADLLDNPHLRDFWSTLHELGFDFPVLRQQGDLLGAVLNWADPDYTPELVDLVTFRPQLPDLTMAPIDLSQDLLKASGLPVSIAGSVNVDIGVVPRIGLGIDSLGLNSMIQAFKTRDWSQVGEDLINSLYLVDQHLVNGQMQDVPELQAWADIAATLGLYLGSRTGMVYGYAQLNGGLNLDLSIDLEDPDGDGKARLLDLIQQGLDGGLPAIFDAQVLAEAVVGASTGLNVNLKPADGLPADWGTVAKAAFEAAVGTWTFFGGQTEFDASLSQQWPIPLYDSKNQTSIFGV